MTDTPIFDALMAEHPIELRPPEKKPTRRLFLDAYEADTLALGMNLIPLQRERQ
ncbi:hypothetical protein PP459_gp152 [Streptomyces phage Wakanda]|uniref:Uncharacterized protein n=2 Tax=Wakandavirus TaxID=3044854 RepID=A0A6G8R398_9CAUD|nr:hypothetical protein PP459_gp152 [Streptomyces phage Wakanda]YP_010652402.1 hypothetical protein PP460_gp156 [Streptomyces phage Muntaha]QIN94081.1 hypothetical protein SEA_WAKANDA_96 [Streptomyces phage Wakanda]QIN94646.1 hypothetical protein SEA_MUNTAHA_98 [Streptomyces phage Muntaha]